MSSLDGILARLDKLAHLLAVQQLRLRVLLRRLA
jgi:hypothetical protein